MVGPPPPPPPGPPPPPALPAFNLGSKSNDSGEARSALLQSIQKGAKLKKTVTVDKSGPLVAGRPAGTSNSAPKSSNHSSNVNSNSSISSNSSIGNDGGPKLGGIFGGMSAMPKLKPVGSRGVPTANRSPPNERAPDTSPPAISQNINANTNSGPLDFSTELQKTLTLKRQKKENNGLSLSNQETTPITTPTPSRPSIINRGPPPQPPSSKNLPNSTSDSILGRSNLATSNTVSASTPSLAGNSSSLFNKGATQQNTNTTSMTDGTSTMSLNSTHGLSIAPNKSSLFNNSNSNTDNNSNTIIHEINSKPVPNYGKPNLAPKPPGVNGNNRPISRHHSMKTPRSPTTNESISFPAANHFGTIRGPPQYQSSESINAGRSINRPTIAPPPRPPPTKPPPPPTRNLTQPIMPLSNLGGSVGTLNHNNNTLKNNFSSMGSVNINGNGNVAPPPPPHRTCPPPPGARQPNNASAIGLVPPAPPQRISSKQRGTSGGAVIINNNNTNMSNTVNRIIMDLETKFAHNFHNVTEFPKPQPFLNLNKIYPSQQNVKSVNG